jgi:hypothetical protein
MTDKDPAEKALFAFTDGAVLAEGLGRLAHIYIFTETGDLTVKISCLLTSPFLF